MNEKRVVPSEGGEGRTCHQIALARAAPTRVAAAALGITRFQNGSPIEICRLGQQELRDGDIGNALPAILDEASPNERADRQRNARRQRAPVRLAAQHGCQRIADVFTVERAPAGEHLVKHASVGPHVAALVG